MGEVEQMDRITAMQCNDVVGDPGTLAGANIEIRAVCPWQKK